METTLIELIIKPYKDKIAELESVIDKLKSAAVSDVEYNSPEMKEFATAFAKAQAEYNPVYLNRENPYFKSSYADLDAILSATRPSLNKHGISFSSDLFCTDKGETLLITELLHSSGQWKRSKMRVVPPKNDVQSFGSTLSYVQRYAAKTLLGIAVSQDRQDDDAEIAMAVAREIVAKGPSNKYNPKEQSSETISKDQLEELEYELVDYRDIGEMVLDKLQLQSLADMPKSKYMVSLERIRQIKQLRNGTKG